MPRYDFRCLNCGKRFDITLSYADYGKAPVHCTFCGSGNVQRRIGRIRVLRSEESRLESMGGLEDMPGLEDDPRELGRALRKMSAEVGEDMGPEFNEVINRLEAGQSTEEIEKSLPEFGGDDEGMGGFGAGLSGGDLDDF
ncbi:MAG: zinc ribbon domain-containing protein [Anaerolineaceae bacterium]|nr:zinc ribbon domain-containing protein [Anaerolineaceae bacterium]